MRVAASYILVALCITLSGCGGTGAPDTNRLTFWRSLTGGAGDAQDELIKRFNETHPNLRVESEFQGDLGNLATKLMTAAVARSGPDVTQLGTFEIRTFARNGLLVDLRPYLDGPEGIDTRDWPGTILSAGEVDGKLCWLPFNVSVPVLYYNADAFRQAGLSAPPKTWTEFYEYARRLTQRDNRGNVRQAGAALWDITWPYISAIWSEGGELTDKDYKNVTLNHPVAVAVLTEFQNLVKEGAATLPPAASGGHRAAFKSGRAAMILDSPAPFDEIFLQSVGFAPEVASYPAGKAGKVFAPGGAGLAILSTSPEAKRAASWQLVKFMLSPESLAYYAQRSGYLAFTGSSRKAAPDLLKDPRRALMHEALAHVRGDFSINMSPAVRTAFDDAFHRIVLENADVKTTLDEADARAERDLREEQ